MRHTLAFDITASATAGVTNATPRAIAGAGSSWAAAGAIFKGPVGAHRVLGLLAVPKLSAAQRAGTDADVVAYRNSLDSTSFAVTAGQKALVGPVWGAACADGLPGSAGGSISDPGGQGDGFLSDEQAFDGETGIVVECGRGAGATTAIAWTVLVFVES